MNTINRAVLDGLLTAIDLAQKNHRGLVIWQTASLESSGSPANIFSAGADLASLAPSFMRGDMQAIESIVAHFQYTMQKIKYARVPVVSAIFSKVVGGGCELALHSTARVAHIESYIGLVEAGIGLLPAGGGLKEMAVRAAHKRQDVYDATWGREIGGELLRFLRKPFKNIAMAKVSSSAREALEMGYLQPSDSIVFNVHELLDSAKRQVRALDATYWRPLLPVKTVPVAGRSALATLKAELLNAQVGDFISEHDNLISQHIAEVLCGGKVEAGASVDENWLLTLERRAFMSLLMTQKTQERIISILQTGKHVRN
jgi:3-hydroxyacyl-CoA dehydrogenase